MPITEANKLTAQIETLLRHAATHIVMPRYRQLEQHEIMEKQPGDLVTLAGGTHFRFSVPGRPRFSTAAKLTAGFLGAALASGLVWWLLSAIA